MTKNHRGEVEIAGGLIDGGSKGDWSWKWIDIFIKIIDSQERKIKRLEKK